jgi:hypothetical protein
MTGKVESGRRTTTALSIRDREDDVVFDGMGSYGTKLVFILCGTYLTKNLAFWYKSYDYRFNQVPTNKIRLAGANLQIWPIVLQENNQTPFFSHTRA